MTDLRYPKDMQIGEDFDHQRRSWVVQRVGWVAFALIIVGALAGLFGRGLAGPALASTDDGVLTVEYPRYWRLQSPMVLRIHVTPRGQGAEELRVWLDRAYLDNFSVSQVVPAPERVEAGSDRLTFVFALGDTAGATAVTFDIEPEKPWRVRGRAGLDLEPGVGFAHFIYP